MKYTLDVVMMTADYILKDAQIQQKIDNKKQLSAFRLLKERAIKLNGLVCTYHHFNGYSYDRLNDLYSELWKED